MSEGEEGDAEDGEDGCKGEDNMRILIIRHGDPDYERDSLTEKGWREAELLSQRLVKMDIKAFYVSPLGRAKDTASLTLKKLNRTAEECPWLREFSAGIKRPDRDGNTIVWDWLPADWTKEEVFFRRDQWYTQEALAAGSVKEEYEWVIRGFDQVLAKHGYVREQDTYRVEQPNEDTIVFFCHFGLACVLLSRLMNVSPMILWHHTFLAPSSVTTLYSEERRKGIAAFRASSIGDISHLYAGGEEPSFSGRFCEVFDSEERHD